MDVPLLFKCPISMELMQDPVTIFTGVTYERKYIERWFFTYKKKTCPATMQPLENLDLTPNHTLHRLISSWSNTASHDGASTSAPPVPLPRGELASILAAVESGPFQVSSLKKLQSAIAAEEAQMEFVELGGIEVVGAVILQILAVDAGDFAAFRACEEALAALYHLPLSDQSSVTFLSKPECIESMIIMLQRGSAEARLHAITILQKVAERSRDWTLLLGDQDREFFRSLLELLSDDIAAKASAAALEVLINLFVASKKSRLKAVELGAVHLFLELLPESTRQRCEKLLFLLTMLCERPEGRSAFAEHAMGIPAVSKKILRVSDVATKLAVKILWLMGTFHPTEKVLDDMLLFGSVGKLLILLQFDSHGSTREKVMDITRLHSPKWRQHPCFPSEFKGMS
ncbi:unnamed protein product [Spirodela intermedia]|uniref:U-box domain-containing protein n=1 Tax=Spirodela intermedia TaxID=51605 RepID=A0A7I8LA50_SPIIN|nr:unnamed protein product [Spirodela intermedia]